MDADADAACERARDVALVDGTVEACLDFSCRHLTALGSLPLNE